MDEIDLAEDLSTVKSHFCQAPTLDEPALFSGEDVEWELKFVRTAVWNMRDMTKTMHKMVDDRHP